MGLTQMALKVLSSNTVATAVRKVLPNGTVVKYVRNGNGFQKIVNKIDGTKTVSNLAKNGEVTGFTLNSSRGKIAYLFGGQPYDKVVEVTPKIGGNFTLLGHRGQGRSGILYSDMSGRYNADNKYIKEFKQAVDYIKGKSSQYLYSLSKLNTKA